MVVHHHQLNRRSLGKGLDISPDHLQVLKIAEQVTRVVAEVRQKGLNSPIIQQTAIHIVVKREIVHLFDADSCPPEAEANGVMGKLPMGMLLADQPFFFNKSDQFTIADQGCGSVMKQASDSEDDHTPLFSSSSSSMASWRRTSCATTSLRMSE